MNPISVAIMVALVGLASTAGIARTYLPPVKQVPQLPLPVYRAQVSVQSPVVRPAAVYLPPSPQILSVSRPTAHVLSQPVPQVLSIAHPAPPTVSITRPIQIISHPNVAVHRQVELAQHLGRPERVYLPPAPQRVILQPRPAVQVISIPRLTAPQRTYLPPQIGAASSLSEQYEETNEL